METTPTQIKYALVEYTTNKNFCNVYDAIAIERLQWEVVSYDRERRVHLDRATCYLPILRCKLLVHQVLGGEARKAGYKLEVFGGSEKDGKIESRVFRLEFDPGADGKFARFPFRLTIAVGPGKRTATSGISPDGPPTTQVSMRFPEDDFVGICLEIRDFLQEHQRDLEAVRRRAQQQHYEGRDEQPRKVQPAQRPTPVAKPQVTPPAPQRSTQRPQGVKPRPQLTNANRTPLGEDESLFAMEPGR